MPAADDYIYNTIMQTVAKSGGLADSYGLMDSISRSMGGGTDTGRYNDMFYGLNRLPNLAPLPMHREAQGLVLFTRPNLNLSYDNISSVRALSALYTQDPTSYQYAVRMMLDPTTYTDTTDAKAVAAASPLVDPRMPYLTLLTNSIQTMSAPPDIGLNMYTSPEGAAKEVWMMNDSISEYNGKYDLTCTFNNFKGNAILALFQAWVTYIGALRVGPCIPHPIQRARDEMDYFTRIERIKLDHSGRYVEQWFHTGASCPTNLSIGASFGFNRDEANDYENKQISVQFASVGAVYNDPIQLLEFNLRIVKWCKAMDDSTRKTQFTKVDRRFMAATNYNGYPWIDLTTFELQWWIENATYKMLVQGL